MPVTTDEASRDRRERFFEVGVAAAVIILGDMVL
jgi:hypothetical protein